MGLRPFSALFPAGHAWSSPSTSILKRLAGVFNAKLTEAASDVHAVFEDSFAETTRELSSWENELGLREGPTTFARRSAIDAALKSDGGQSLTFLQNILQSAGFNVWVHTCWASESLAVRRDPRVYANPPEYGTELCTDQVSWGQPQCTSVQLWDQPQCNGVVRGVNYFNNITLQDDYVPPIPNDSVFWPFFIYVGGETFPEYAEIDMSRYDELMRLICRHRPLRHWVVLLVQGDPVDPPGTDTMTMDDITDEMDGEAME